MYAVIRIRGTVNVKPKIRKTLELLNLRRVNNLSLFKQEGSALEMIRIAKDYVTFGEISEKTLKELVAKRATPLTPGEKIDAAKIAAEMLKGKSAKDAGIKTVFCLNPPRGGFERKGIKIPFKMGGALGNRKEKINELIERMI